MKIYHPCVPKPAPTPGFLAGPAVASLFRDARQVLATLAIAPAESCRGARRATSPLMNMNQPFASR